MHTDIFHANVPLKSFHTGCNYRIVIVVMRANQDLKKCMFANKHFAKIKYDCIRLLIGPRVYPRGSLVIALVRPLVRP